MLHMTQMFTSKQLWLGINTKLCGCLKGGETRPLIPFILHNEYSVMGKWELKKRFNMKHRVLMDSGLIIIRTGRSLKYKGYVEIISYDVLLRIIM